MATSFIGPYFTASASITAPVPLPPHPTRASWIVLFSAANTPGIMLSTRTEAAVMRPAFFKNERRDDVPVGLFSFMTVQFL